MIVLADLSLRWKIPLRVMGAVLGTALAVTAITSDCTSVMTAAVVLMPGFTRSSWVSKLICTL